MEHETFLNTQEQTLRAGAGTTAASTSLAQTVSLHTQEVGIWPISCIRE